MLQLRTLVVAATGLGLVQVAEADWLPSKTEMATLPPYCAARFNEGSAEFKSWQETMGGDFLHVHHYCAALNFLNRARGMVPGPDRRGTLGAALTNFDYILKHTQPEFYLRADTLMNRGIALSMLQRKGEAIADLQQAIEKNPKLPAAYVTLADMYDGTKNRTKALEVVTAGLRQNPGKTSLQRRYTELGGKLPYPAPAEPPAPAIAAEASSPAAAAGGPAADAAASPTAEPAIVTPKIGSPTNPYCRFCPD